MASSSQTPYFSPKLYDGLKFVAQILLPALGTLYFTLAETWHFPYGPEVVGTITAVDLFLGVVLGFSSHQYYKNGANFDGDALVFHEDGGVRVRLSGDRLPEDMVDQPGKHSIEFRIKHMQGTDDEQG